MAYRVYVPTLDDYIYFGTKYLGPGFDAGNVDFCLGSKPYKFDAYKHCMNFYNIDPTTSRTSGWIPLFRASSTGFYFNYSLGYDLDAQTVRFSVGTGPTSSAVSSVRIRLVFSLETAVPEREKYLFFSDIKTFYKNENTFRSIEFGISQYGGLGAVGTWNNTYKRYDYNITDLRLSLDEFYNSAGIYTPNLPVGNNSADYPGTIIKYWQGSTRDEWAKNGTYNTIACTFESLGNTWSLSDIIQVDGTPIDPDAPEPGNDDPNTNDPEYPSGPGGGGGNHDRTSDPIEVPSLPGISALSTGFMTLYYGNTQMIHAFMSNLWVQNIADAIKNFFAQPMDFILGAMILPIASQLTAASAGSARPKFGLVTFDSALPYVETQFYEVDCGEINIEEYWGSCFDFDPYTKITIWLPYIGYKDLLADEVMGHSIYVKYHIDAMNGDCVAFVGVSSIGPQGPDITKILGQYTGNCGVQIPLSGQSFDAAVATSITLLGSAAGVGISAGLGAAGLGEGISGDAAMALTHATASVVSNMKPNITRSGSMGSSSGLMSMRTPYIIKRIPRQSLPENFRELRGYPSNIYATLSQLTGFAAVEDIQLNNIPALETERKEIIEWLKGGVLL